MAVLSNTTHLLGLGSSSAWSLESQSRNDWASSIGTPSLVRLRIIQGVHASSFPKSESALHNYKATLSSWCGIKVTFLSLKNNMEFPRYLVLTLWYKIRNSSLLTVVKSSRKLSNYVCVCLNYVNNYLNRPLCFAFADPSPIWLKWFIYLDP